MRVEKLARGDAMFYQRLGPIFGSREIGKEVGISVYDDEDKVFYAAFDGDVMLGIASVRKGLVSDCWTGAAASIQGRADGDPIRHPQGLRGAARDLHACLGKRVPAGRIR